jgi:hypothetical protein
MSLVLDSQVGWQLQLFEHLVMLFAHDFKYRIWLWPRIDISHYGVL